MDEKTTVIIAGCELTIKSEDSSDYIDSIAKKFNDDISSIQLSHAKSTKLESILMCGLNYLDDKTRLESEVEKLKRENEELNRRVGTLRY